MFEEEQAQSQGEMVNDHVLGMYDNKRRATVYRDDLTGQPLDADLVQQARKKELEYFNGKGVWQKCARAECLAATGKQPIT